MRFSQNLVRPFPTIRLSLVHAAKRKSTSRSFILIPITMRPTQALNGGGAPNWKVGNWIGDWGQMGGAKQKGIIHYGVSANRLDPMKGTLHDAVFNTFRRTKGQIFYWVPPLVAAYYLLEWATERNHFLNSKHGRAEFGDEE